MPSLNDSMFEKTLRLRLQKKAPVVCPKTEMVALVLTGGASSDQIQKASEHLAQCNTCQQAVDFINAENVLEQENPQKLGYRWQWVAWPAVFLLLAAGVWFWQAKQQEMDKPSQAFLLKGASDQIEIAIQRGDKRFKIHAGDKMESGDQLGFFYTAQKPGYLALFNVDGNGEVSLFFPAEMYKSKSIESGIRLPLPEGGVFSKKLVCEWLVGVFSDEALPLDELQDTLSKAGRQASHDCQLDLQIDSARSIWLFQIQ